MKLSLTVACLAFCVAAQAAPSDLDTNEIITNKKLYKKGVSASFGGYRASAGLGGDGTGGGLYASAGTPDGPHAGAGLFGGAAGAGASAGSGSSSGFYYGGAGAGGQRAGNEFFDRIFAIPINVLHSVNDYVKTKGGPGVPPGKVGASAGAGAVTSDGSGAVRFATVSEEKVGSGSSGFAASSASASASAGGSGSGLGVKAGAGVGDGSTYHYVHKNDGHYDRVFNIPITALKSVNDFLNG